MYRYSIALNNLQTDRFGIQNLELTDGCFGLPLCDMNGDQLEDVRNTLITQLSRIVLYRTDMSVAEYDRYVRFFRHAHLLQVENVLLTCKAVHGASNETIAQIIRIAAAFSIRILFCFEAAYIDEFNFDRYGQLRGEYTGIFYDPNEFTKQEQQPFRDILYKNKYNADIVFLRIEDMLYNTHTPMMLEKGNSQIKECASWLLARNYNGYFSLAAYGDFTVQNILPAFCRMMTEM